MSTWTEQRIGPDPWTARVAADPAWWPRSSSTAGAVQRRPFYGPQTRRVHVGIWQYIYIYMYVYIYCYTYMYTYVYVFIRFLCRERDDMSVYVYMECVYA